MNSKKFIKLGFLNPGSLGTRHDEFIAAMLDHDVDIMALNETWLRPGEEGRAPVVPGYSLIHTPRPAAIRARVPCSAISPCSACRADVVEHKSKWEVPSCRDCIPATVAVLANIC